MNNKALCNLRIVIISYYVCPSKAFSAYSRKDCQVNIIIKGNNKKLLQTFINYSRYIFKHWAQGTLVEGEGTVRFDSNRPGA